MSFGYEKEDISIASVLKISLISVGLLVAVVVITSQFFKQYKDGMYYERVLEPDSKKLLTLRQHEDEMLHNFGVIDGDEGKYRIPIDRAMELVIQEKQSQ